MQDGFTTNNTRPEKRRKCNRRSALFLLSSSPILTVHVQSLRRSDILRRPALESVSPESRPTFRQNYIEVKAFRNEATLRNRGDLPAVCCAGRASAKKSLLSAHFNFVSTTQHVHEVLFGSTSVPTHARKKADVHSSSDHRLYDFA
jgi:hypothetical protein